MRWPFPALLSLTGGYADTSGFLALKGLFTSHVTGNFVTLGSALVFGTSGALAKTLALPVFCLAVFLARLLAFRLQAWRQPVLRRVLQLQLLLLILVAALAASWGPFDDADAAPALVVGMTLVAAMAIQNAVHRTRLAELPPSTIMTGTTTQIMVDLASMAHGMPVEVAASIRARFKRLTLTVAAFAAGCGLASLLYAEVSTWCFCVLPVLGLGTLMMRADISNADSLH
jgi:uncharacterized membrane protein YoaK (UPF0700 family)